MPNIKGRSLFLRSQKRRRRTSLSLSLSLLLFLAVSSTFPPRLLSATSTRERGLLAVSAWLAIGRTERRNAKAPIQRRGVTKSLGPFRETPPTGFGTASRSRFDSARDRNRSGLTNLRDATREWSERAELEMKRERERERERETYLLSARSNAILGTRSGNDLRFGRVDRPTQLRVIVENDDVSTTDRSTGRPERRADISEDDSRPQFRDQRTTRRSVRPSPKLSSQRTQRITNSLQTRLSFPALSRRRGLPASFRST